MREEKDRKTALLQEFHSNHSVKSKMLVKLNKIVILLKSLKREQENPRNNKKQKNLNLENDQSLDSVFFAKDIISQKIKNGDQRERERDVYFFDFCYFLDIIELTIYL